MLTAVEATFVITLRHGEPTSFLVYQAAYRSEISPRQTTRLRRFASSGAALAQKSMTNLAISLSATSLYGLIVREP